MKQFITFLALIFSYMLCGAQATTLVVDNQTPGWLSSKINYGDQQTVENLTVTGYINKADLSFIGDLMSKHNLTGHLDLTDVEVVDTYFKDDTNGAIEGELSMFKLNDQVSLSRFSIPKSIPKISQYLLPKIQADTLDYGSELCQVLTPFLIDNSFYGTNHCPKVLILREGVTKIQRLGQTNQWEERNLETIILPQTVDSIGYKAFVSCTNLSNVNLPESIHTIGSYAFAQTSFKPDTLHLPSQLRIYHTNSFPLKSDQVIVIPSSTEEFDNTKGDDYHLNFESGIQYYYSYTFIINRVTPPIFRANRYGPNYRYLSSCNLYVPKEGLPLYQDPNYQSNIYGEDGNTYAYANKLYPIAVPVDSVVLNYHSYDLNVGNSINLSVTIQPKNADDSSVIWQSSDTNIAAVNQYGLVTALLSGQANIKASSKENPNIFDICKITVIQPLQSITLNSKNITLNAGQSYESLSLTYYPTTADNKNVTWKSSNSEIIKVDTFGKITAIREGVAKVIVISDENNNIRDECIITVLQPTTGISLDKTDIEIIEDESIQLIATVFPENASNKSVNWTSSDVSIAMVAPDGTVYAIKPGQATIMATTVDGGYVALCKVTVKAKTILTSNIELSSNSESIAVGETLQLNAIISPDNASNKAVNWTSTNPSIASVNAMGLVTAISEGKTQIIATTTDGSNLSAICEITVNKQFITISQLQITPSNARIPVGQTLDLCATITPDDATNKNIKWSSTNPAVASVSDLGIVSAVSDGNAIIIASTQDGSNLSATCLIEVYTESVLVESINLSSTKIEGVVNEIHKIEANVLPVNATVKNLKWTSSDDNIATVDNGIVKMNAIGTAIITAEATDGSLVKSECSVIVSQEVGLASTFEDKNPCVKVFNLSGCLIYEGLIAEVKLTPGFYIVICNGTSFKINIK